MNDPVEWAKSVAAIVKDYCGKELAPIVERLNVVEQRQPEKGEPGKDGRDGIDGKDGTLGKDGRDGIDGKDGAPGERGSDGKDGANGKDGIDGKDGAPGSNGRDGVDGKDGAPGRDGIDGKSITVDDVLPHFHQAFDKWALDFERRAQDIHTRLLSTFDKPKDGQDGVDGKDGADGLGFDDLRVEHDGERAFTFIHERGERRKEFTFKLPVVLERGVYKADRTYDRGDAVTCDGSYWIAQKDAPSGKPGQSPDWRLAVKKGRDGKGS
jgi:hypothetical protein